MKLAGLIILSVLSSGDALYPKAGLCGAYSLQPMYQWSSLKYSGKPDPSYIGNSTYPTGLEEYGGRFYMSTPRDLASNMATLSTISSNRTAAGTSSPILEPYPDSSWHQLPSKGVKIDCDKTLVSVHRTETDECNRLWVLDSGNVDEPETPKRVCPPKIVIFDLKTNQPVRVINITDNVVPTVSIFTSIILDDMIASPDGKSWSSTWDDNNCDNTFAYIADIGNPGVVVYNHMTGSFYRMKSPFMAPDPSYPSMQLNGQTFTCFFGVNEIALSGSGNSRSMYFQPVASQYIYSMPTSFLQAGPFDGDASKMPVRRVVQKMSGGIGLETDPMSGCVLYNQVSQNSINTYNPLLGTTRPVAASRDLALVFDFSEDSQDKKVMYALSVDFIKYLQGSVKMDAQNIRVFKLTTII